MVFSVSNDGIEWHLDYEPDSVTLTSKDLVQKMTIFSLEIPVVIWSMLLTQIQDFLKNHLERVLSTPQPGKVY